MREPETKRQRRASAFMKDLRKLMLNHHRGGRGLDALELVGFGVSFFAFFPARLHGPEVAQAFLDELAAHSATMTKATEEEALAAWLEEVEPMSRS